MVLGSGDVFHKPYIMVLGSGDVFHKPYGFRLTNYYQLHCIFYFFVILTNSCHHTRHNYYDPGTVEITN